MTNQEDQEEMQYEKGPQNEFQSYIRSSKSGELVVILIVRTLFILQSHCIFAGGLSVWSLLFSFKPYQILGLCWVTS